MKIEQCLFGYDDGHRLLASSSKLPPDAASELTIISDVAPGTFFGGPLPYYTGFPVPKLGRYALMATWSAPEMPRPGCVWSHALLLDTSLFEQVGELAHLRKLLKKPSVQRDWSGYSQVIDVPVFDRDSDASQNLAELMAVDLITTLYASSGNAIEVNAPGELDDLVFRAWSQQWPRLRRNFRFQTATRREPSSTSSERFDLRLHLGSRHDDRRPLRSDDGDWIGEAVDDLYESQPSPFRDFLWKYGKDVKRQRGSFRPLSRLFCATTNTTLSLEHEEIGAILNESFPEPNDAAELKQAFLDGSLVPEKQLEIWLALLVGGSFPTIDISKDQLSSFVTNWWSQSPLKTIETVEWVKGAGLDGAEEMMEIVASRVDSHMLFSIEADRSELKASILQRRPDLLASALASPADREIAVNIISEIDEVSALFPFVIDQLVKSDELLLVQDFIERFPSRSIAAFFANLDAGGHDTPAWRSELARRPDLLLDALSSETVKRTHTLYKVADLVGWLNPLVLGRGVEPWHNALISIKSDLPADETLILRCFLLALAISSGGSGTAEIFEKNFDYVHGHILHSYLPWRASDLLTPVLAWAGYMKSWDIGLRLRLAVAQAYVRQGLPEKSYAKLSKDRFTRSKLADAAQEVDGGGALAREIKSRR